MSFAVIYRWRVKPGMEAQFERAWSEGTAAIHERCDSFGARLHKAKGDFWVSYARWPDAEARAACFRDNDFRALGFLDMREAVAETLPEIVLDVVDDQLDEPRTSGAPPIPHTPLDLGGGVGLRPLDPRRDAAALFAVFGDQGSSVYLSSPAHESVEQTRRSLVRWQSPGSPQWVIAEGEGPALGRVTLISRRRGVAEIGIQVVPAARGRGLARRAACAVTAYALDELGLVRVEADVDPANRDSARVFERSGFTLEGRRKNTWITHTGVWDSLIFAATTGWKPPA